MNLNFAENFKRLRKEKEITQEKLAEALGVSSQSVSRWELSICYPDLELLPSIANYFGVTVDELLSNDSDSKEKDREHFLEKFDTLSSLTTERIDFAQQYCRKYPSDDFYTAYLFCAIHDHTVGDKEKTKKYMPQLLKCAERLLETSSRSMVIQTMASVCEESDLEAWLRMAPYTGLSRRYCLVARAMEQNDTQLTYVQNGLEMFETLARQLDSRCPDRIGAKTKEAHQRAVLKTVESFGEGGEIPDGWKMFYAYKQLVLSACLFGSGDTEEGWMHFDSAMEKCRYIYSREDEWLEIGGALFSDLRVSRDWNFAVDESGNRHKLFAMINHSFYHARHIYGLLTNPSWAWFNPVRDTEKYKSAVAFLKEVRDKQDAEA